MKTTRALRKLRGAIHPQYYKTLTRNCAIEPITPIPESLSILTAQHLGAPAKPLVKKGDEIKAGQRIAEAAGFISAHIHSPVFGTVTAVEDALTITGSRAPCIKINPIASDAPPERMSPITDWQSVPTDELVKRIADAGIVGMGGAGFPTHVKLSPPPDKAIDTLVVNGAECEPFLTADHRMMIEQAQSILEGISIICSILDIKSVRIAIEDNKPEAIEAMQQAANNMTQIDASLVILPTLYPQGAEKQQIFMTTGREVPSGGLPMDVGCVVENVGTIAACRNAIIAGIPLTHRVTTVTGHIVKQPKNILAPIGTSFTDLLAFCGGLSAPAAKVIAGGPMMGMAQPGLDVSTTKTTSGLVMLEADKVHHYQCLPCIGCGRCVDACPMDLIPAEISNFVEAGDYEGAEHLSILDCIECGCCSFSCPATRPLVQHFKLAKPAILLKRRQKVEKKGNNR